MEPCNSDIEDKNNLLLANLREQLYCPTGTQSLVKKALSEKISARHSYMHVHIYNEMYHE